MLMTEIYSRRQLLIGSAVAALQTRFAAAVPPTKPMRGVFIIMATPYTEANAVDYEDLAREVDFLDRCGVHGMVWPQLASEYSKLTKEERMRGMEAIGKRPRARSRRWFWACKARTKPPRWPTLEKARTWPSPTRSSRFRRPKPNRSTISAITTAPWPARRSRPLFFQTTGGAKGSRAGDRNAGGAGE